ncbi:MAG: PAS domain-containing protein [Bacteroidota bacterium]
MLQVAVILTDAQQNILWVNQDFTNITGYSVQEVVGKNPRLLQGKDTDASTVTRIRESLKERVPIKDELMNYKKDGTPYICRLVIYPVLNQKQDVINYIAFEVNADYVSDDTGIPLMQLSEKYNSSSLRGMEEMQLYYQLQRVLEEEKLYLDANLSLRQLADRLDTNTKYLSQVVNHLANSNFQHYLNTFRIREVTKKIVDPAYRNLTLFGIALQCGFKNKSTFYKVFREIMGMTPKVYIKDQANKEKNLVRS